MLRRTLIRGALSALVIPLLPIACVSYRRAKPGAIMTVNGWVPAADMGLTLTHEHAFADLRTFSEQKTTSLKIDIDEVIEVVLPYLQTIKALGCRTFVDATATHLGRHPALLKALSDASGLQILTVTGAYLAADGRFIPDYAYTDDAETLAGRWIAEWQNGIEGTDIRPGFIKIAFNGGPLTVLERKILDAAIKTHKATGLTIASHIGHFSDQPGFNGKTAEEVLSILQAAGVSADAWIWIHAQNEIDPQYSLMAAGAGAYVSFDGYRPGDTDTYMTIAKRFADHQVMDRVLFSQDAGWYTAGEPDGGDFSPFDPILRELVPALRKSFAGESVVEQIFIANPASAFTVAKRIV